MSVIRPNDMKYVPKRWGYEIWICNNEKYCGKKLWIRHGKYCSMHYHKNKDEVLYIEKGKIIMNFRRKEDSEVATMELTEGHAFHLEPGVVHQMYALEDTMILEFSTQHFDEDSYRETTELVAGND